MITESNNGFPDLCETYAKVFPTNSIDVAASHSLVVSNMKLFLRYNPQSLCYIYPVNLHINR